MIPSSGGVFEVTFDGAVIFSKRAQDRFPEHGEIYQEIDRRRAGAPADSGDGD